MLIVVNTLKTSAIFILFIYSSAIFAYSGQSANQPYENALESFYQSDLNTAIIHLKNALKNNPKHLPSLVLLAEVYIAIGDGAAAEEQLIKAKVNNADNNKVIPLILEAYLLQNKYQQILATKIIGHQNNKLIKDILLFKARAYVAENKLEQAKGTFQRVLDIASNNIKANLGLAQVYLLKRDNKKAKTFIDRVLTLSPTNTNALVMLANYQQTHNNTEQALTTISQVIALNKKNFPALLTRASLYIEQNKHQLALNDIEVILAEIPNEPKANYLKLVSTSAIGLHEETEKTAQHINLVLSGLPNDIMKQNPIYLYLGGVVSFQKKQYIKAQDFLQTYLKIIEDDIRALKLLARIEIELDNPLLAKALLIKSRLIAPNDPETLSLLGDTYLTLNEYELSTKYFEDVIKLSNGSPEAHYDLAKLQLLSDKPSDAISHLKIAMSLDNNIDILILLSKAYQENKQLNHALKTINQAIKQQPNNTFLYVRKGTLLGLLNQHTEAKSAFQHAQMLDKNNLAALIHLARIDVQNNHSAKAITAIKNKLADLKQPNVSLLIELGSIYQQIDEKDKALQEYNKAYSVDRNNQNSLINILNLHLSSNKIKQAINIADEYVERNNNHADVYLALANLHMANKTFDSAFLNFQLAAKNSLNKASIYNRFADAQTSLHDFQGAIGSLRKAIAWDKDNLSSLIKLFNVYAKQADETEALKVFKEIKQRIEEPSYLKALKGDLYRTLQAYKKSESFYLSSNKSKMNQQAVYGLYRVYKYQARFNEALSLLKPWLKLNPNDITAQIALAESFDALGDYKSSIKQYQLLMSQYSETPIFLNNLAQVYIKTNQYQLAENNAQKALAILPDNVAILDTMAWSYTLNNKVELALPLFRQAIVKDSENREIKYHLAFALAKLGRNNEAMKYLREALIGNSHFNDKDEAKKLYEQLSS